MIMKTYKEEEIKRLIHDIKNPLTSILSFSEMLSNSQEELSEEERKELSDLIHEEAKRIIEILDIFRGKKNRLEESKEEELKSEKEFVYCASKNGQAKILVVDDDGSIRRIIKMDLEKVGYDVYTVYDAEEALKIMDKIEPDIIISDVRMPKIDGFEFYRILKERKKFIPFVFLTANDDIKDKVLGIRLGVDAYLTKPFSKEELLAVVESILLKSKKISMDIFVDPLTKVYNRRFIETKFPKQIERAIELNIPISFVMCDIDHFKRINDTFGHQIGDLVLEFLGKFLKKHVRENDLIARYGGEEFLILLHGVNKNKAYDVVNRLLKDLSGEKIYIGKEKWIKITISAGISSLPEDGTDLETLIKAADRGLYEAKNAGRNRVVLA